LNSGPSLWATPSALFCDGFFWDRVSWTICPSWLRTLILLISASWVARITGVSHWCPIIPFTFSYAFSSDLPLGISCICELSVSFHLNVSSLKTGTLFFVHYCVTIAHNYKCQYQVVGVQ
jgi:hypothetical protein